MFVLLLLPRPVKPTILFVRRCFDTHVFVSYLSVYTQDFRFKIVHMDEKKIDFTVMEGQPECAMLW